MVPSHSGRDSGESKVPESSANSKPKLLPEKSIDELIEEVSENENPLIESLIDTLGTLIKDYEDRNIPEPEADAIGCLKFLIEEHKLKASDLQEIGSQEVVSEILSGKRQLNVRQIKALSQRFNVSPAVFI